MVQYNPKDWFTFIFKVHKADTVRKLGPLLVGMVVYATIIVLLEIRFKLIDEETFKNLPQMHTLLGLAISMLLVFRTNTAYERWWEGRKLWGSLVNMSRNLAIKLDAFLDKAHQEPRDFMAKHIAGFAKALHYHLRNEAISHELEELIPGRDTQQPAHMPIEFTDRILKKINGWYVENKISAEQFLVLNSELVQFMDICGACERIKNTPIPFSYSVFIKKIIFFYTMTLPFGFAFSMGFLAIPVTVFIFYVLASLELIAEEIEDPFSGDENDLPTLKLADNIANQVRHILAVSREDLNDNH
jgi:ion channel-forming bestrophin family protein